MLADEHGSTDTGRGVLVGHVVTPDGWRCRTPLSTSSTRPAARPSQRRRPRPLQPWRAASRHLHLITAAAGHAPQARTRPFNGAGRSTGPPGALPVSAAPRRTAHRNLAHRSDPLHVAATALHIGFAKIHGRFRDFAGARDRGRSLDDSSVEVVIDAASIDTGNADRDAHLRSPDFLDVAAFPQIRYTVAGRPCYGPDTWQLDGELTMKTATRPVPLRIDYLGTGKALRRHRAGVYVTTELDPRPVRLIWNQSLLAGVFAVVPHPARHHRHRGVLPALIPLPPGQDESSSVSQWKHHDSMK